MLCVPLWEDNLLKPASLGKFCVTVQHHKNTPIISHVTCFSQSPFLPAHRNSNLIQSAGLVSSAQTEGTLVSSSFDSPVMSSPIIAVRKLLDYLQVPQVFLPSCQTLPSGHTSLQNESSNRERQQDMHMKKKTEMELAPFSSMHPSWRIPCRAWGLPASIANGTMWIKWIFGDEQNNDQNSAPIPYKLKYFIITGPLKAYCLYVKDQK